jgi:hypothetical protein
MRTADTSLSDLLFGQTRGRILTTLYAPLIRVGNSVTEQGFVNQASSPSLLIHFHLFEGEMKHHLGDSIDELPEKNESQ